MPSIGKESVGRARTTMSPRPGLADIADLRLDSWLLPLARRCDRLRPFTCFIYRVISCDHIRRHDSIK